MAVHGAKLVAELKGILTREQKESLEEHRAARQAKRPKGEEGFVPGRVDRNTQPRAPIVDVPAARQLTPGPLPATAQARGDSLGPLGQTRGTVTAPLGRHHAEALRNELRRMHFHSSTARAVLLRRRMKAVQKPTQRR